MMTKINFEENFEIYLFTYPDQATAPSKLNEFLSFLKFNKVAMPYKFSFVSTEASLIPEMTLNQNLLMDFSPNSLTESKEVQFQDFLKVQENRALEELYHTILMPHELPAHSNAEMKKVCSLIKSLLSEGQYIFLESPEADLSPNTLELFIRALKEHMKEHQKNVFVFSSDVAFWMDHSHKMVTRTPDYSFKTSSISRHHQWKKERDHFYAPAAVEKESGLQFRIPASKKKTAA